VLKKDRASEIGAEHALVTHEVMSKEVDVEKESSNMHIDFKELSLNPKQKIYEFVKKKLEHIDLRSKFIGGASLV
jgi:hypothetical protein